MKKNSAIPNERPKNDACALYREKFSEFVCEVEDYLAKEPAIRDRIRKQKNASLMNNAKQIHHIWGRGKAVAEREWFCSLVQVSKACHDAGHDFSPLALEVASLMAKRDRHERYRLMLETRIYSADPEHLLHWNIRAMNKVCGCVSLAGRIEAILLPGLIGTAFEPMCGELLKYAEGN